MAWFKTQPDEPDAVTAYQTVAMTIQVAMEVAYMRATRPGAFPIIPANNVADHFTRSLLADLIEAGYAPEGWQKHYLESSIDWPDPWTRPGKGH